MNQKVLFSSQAEPTGTRLKARATMPNGKLYEVAVVYLGAHEPKGLRNTLRRDLELMREKQAAIA